MQSITKKCSSCKEVKDISLFSKDKFRKDGVCTTCKDCRSLHQKEHKEQTRQKVQRYRDKNREKVNLAQRIYRALNLSKELLRDKQYRENNLEKIKEKDRNYIKNNPEKNRVKSMKRHALKRGAKGRGVTAEQWIEIMNKYGNKCLCCGYTGQLAIDHIIPLINGGEHDVNNIQPLCRSCNSKKGTKTIDYRFN